MGELESSYYAHRGFDAEHTRRVRSFYAPRFDGASPVLEVGCGQGEFLDLLRERGVDARGVDVDEGMVARGRARGHDVALGDAITYLEGSVAAGSLGGVFCAHLLEHLVADDAFRLVDAAGRALRPGGVLVLVVPNPACHAVLTHDFWCDPTHIRFYDVPLIEFLCTQAGLMVAESGTNPLDHPGPPPGFDVEVVMEDADVYAPLDGDVEPDAVVALRRQLRQTQSALRELQRAHRALVWGLYEPNEVFVAATAPQPDAPR